MSIGKSNSFQTWFDQNLRARALSEDAFGADFAGREIVYDAQNKDLFQKMLLNHLQWQKANGQFHPQFQSDFNKLKRLQYYTYASTLGGSLFAMTVWNANFVKRRSWYMRKISIFAWTIIGYNFGAKYVDDQMCMMMLKMNDYLPLEIKRALQDKDFRHLALFDPSSRQQFDPETGKALS